MYFLFGGFLSVCQIICIYALLPALFTHVAKDKKSCAIKIGSLRNLPFFGCPPREVVGSGELEGELVSKVVKKYGATVWRKN